MNVKIIIPILVAAIVAVAAISVFALGSHNDDKITTTVTIEDGLTCTINGQSVNNGGTVTLEKGPLELHVVSSTMAKLGFAGLWKAGSKTVQEDNQSDFEITTLDYTIYFPHGDFKGDLSIKNLGADDLSPVTLTFKYDETKLKATVGGNIVGNGQTHSFPNDGTIHVESLIGTVNIKYDGSWTGPYGDTGGAHGNEYASSTDVSIVNCAYFGEMTGTIEFTYSQE